MYLLKELTNPLQRTMYSGGIKFFSPLSGGKQVAILRLVNRQAGITHMTPAPRQGAAPDRLTELPNGRQGHAVIRLNNLISQNYSLIDLAKRLQASYEYQAESFAIRQLSAF